MAAEHVATHYRRSNISERLRYNSRAFVNLAVLKAMHRAPDLKRKYPLVQTHAADPERVFHTLLGTSDKAVERHRDLEANPGHCYLAIPRTTSANACTRVASLAPVASRSSCPASVLSALARFAPLICSALFNALPIADVRVVGSPLSRTSWSRYARATGNAAGHTSFGWLCGLSSSKWTSFAASISFCVRSAVGVSLNTSSPRAISEP